ncbi:MAG TPA: acyltransferase, partial [Tepidisphaeraceae bacterium]|nr:acyltransferase [Tepidisphaeraceae bacterium]
MNDSTRHQFVALDLLRGLAALMVLLVHARGDAFVEFGALPPDQRTYLIGILFGFTRLGQEAVLAFFVLSGFLVGGQLIDKSRRGTFDVRIYAIDRMTRILMPLIPACILTAIVDYFLYATPPHTIQLIANMVGLNGLVAPTLPHDIPLWSLAYEIWFYVAAGAAAYLFARRVSLSALLTFAFALAALSVLGASYLLCWMLGAATFLMLGAKRSGPTFTGGLAVFAFGALLLELGAESKSFTNFILLPDAATRIMVCLGISMLFPFLCTKRAAAAIEPIRRPAQGLAAFSYSLYLTHYPVLEMLEGIFSKADALSVRSVSIFGLKIAICLGAAWLFYL